MKTINASVTEQNLIIPPSVLSVQESVSLYELSITYDSEWDDVDTKIVTFRGANGYSVAIEDTGEGVTIPWEVLSCPGKVYVGVVGYAGSVQKLTTTGLYDRNTFVVLPASLGLKEAITPTPDIYQKLLQVIGDPASLNTQDKSSLVAAINEVLETAGVTSISDDSGAEASGDVSIKTVNGNSLIGTGNIEIKGGFAGAKVENTTLVFETDAVSVVGTTIIFKENE